MKPELIDSNFFTREQCDKVFNTVMSLKEEWINIKDTAMNKPTPGVDINKHFAHFFGPSVYSMVMNNGDISKYLETKDHYRNILFNEFSELYDHIAFRISQVLAVQCFYDDSVAPPGFHIFGPGLDHDVTYDYFHYHMDRFPAQLNDIIRSGHVYSFIIPIRLPKSGGGLLYNQDETFQYSEGSLSYWNGTIPHKIAGFTLNGENDWRITWQIHVVVGENFGTIFW
jgi:hypothetical protein